MAAHSSILTSKAKRNLLTSTFSPGVQHPGKPYHFCLGSTPIRVLITVIQQPLSGTILLYLLQLDREFHTHTKKLLLIKKKQIALIENQMSAFF